MSSHDGVQPKIPVICIYEEPSGLVIKFRNDLLYDEPERILANIYASTQAPAYRENIIKNGFIETLRKKVTAEGHGKDVSYIIVPGGNGKPVGLQLQLPPTATYKEVIEYLKDMFPTYQAQNAIHIAFQQHVLQVSQTLFSINEYWFMNQPGHSFVRYIPGGDGSPLSLLRAEDRKIATQVQELVHAILDGTPQHSLTGAAAAPKVRGPISKMIVTMFNWRDAKNEAAAIKRAMKQLEALTPDAVKLERILAAIEGPDAAARLTQDILVLNINITRPHSTTQHQP